MSTGPDEQWINRMVFEGRSFLRSQVASMIRQIALATPFPGDIGDEYDMARDALRSLHDRLLREAGWCDTLTTS